MKKILFVSCLLTAMFLYTKAQVVFDPATYNPASLPAGMSIVDIEGTSYCQIILNGWESYIEVEPVEVTEDHTDFTTTAKYAVGADNGGYTIEQINVFLKLANADFSVEIAGDGAASSADFTEYTFPIESTGSAERFQMAGQETTGWGALVGDTLWVGVVSLVGGVTDLGNLDITSANQFRVFPNPANVELNIECNGKIETIQIISITGTIFRDITNDRDKIDITDLKNGLYMIKVQTSEGVYSDSFIKQ